MTVSEANKRRLREFKEFEAYRQGKDIERLESHLKGVREANSKRRAENMKNAAWRYKYPRG